MGETVTLKQIQAKLSDIEEKVSAILSFERKKQLVGKLNQEEAVSDWAVRLVRMGRKGRLDSLKAKGLI